MLSSILCLFGADGIILMLCAWDSLFLLFLYFEVRDGKQNSVLYVWKVIPTFVPIEGGVANCFM